MAHCGWSLVLALAAVVAPARGGQVHEFTSPHMGTRFTIKIVGVNFTQAEAAAQAAFARIAAIEQVLTDYSPKSEAMTVCRSNDAQPGVPIPVSRDLFDCLKVSLDVARQSGGKFDPTVGPLTKLWRLARRTQEPTPGAELAAALKLVSYRHLTLDPEARTVTFAVPGVRLDFGGIGKGFAADEALRLLRDKHQFTQVLIAAGGDITCGDAPDGQPGWRVEVRPLRAGGETRTLVLKNQSVSTSGDLDQVALIGGVRYSHVLDPTTGVGLTGRRSVTVVAPTGTLADALTKVASVLPPDQVANTLAQWPGTEFDATVQPTDDADTKTTSSPGFKALLQKPYGDLCLP